MSSLKIFIKINSIVVLNTNQKFQDFFVYDSLFCFNICSEYFVIKVYNLYFYERSHVGFEFKLFEEFYLKQ